MRVVVLGAGGAHKTEASIVSAARELGHACRLVNVVGWSRRLGPLAPRAVRYLTEAFEPDFVLLTRHALLAGERTIRSLLRGRDATFWFFDLQPVPPALAFVVERMYTTYLGQVERYRAAGVPLVQFLPQGVDPTRDFPASIRDPALRCDASFVGSGQPAYRHTVLAALASVCRLQIRGPGWEGASANLPVAGGPVHGQRLRQVITAADISLGASSHPEQDTERASASNRMWKVMGCGGFYLGPYVQDIDRLAVGGRHCAWYRSAADAAEQARHYLPRSDERRRIAEAGRAHALTHHTYARRLELLLAGRAYDPADSSDKRVVAELEHPDTGQPLDRR